MSKAREPSRWKLGLGYAWTLTQLANSDIELSWAAAALVLAAWLGR